MMRIFFTDLVFIAVVGLIAGCVPGTDQTAQKTTAKRTKQPIGRLAGETDVIPSTPILDKGEALISYSDCAACHKATDRKRGPAFRDIAARYPMNSTYIDILTKRIVQGAKGAWGNVVMPPHPSVSEEDAQTMVMYILSLGAGE